MICYTRRCIEQIISLVLISVILRVIYNQGIFGFTDTRTSIMLTISIVGFGLAQFFALRDCLMSINSLRAYYSTNIVSYLTVFAVVAILGFVLPYNVYQYVCLPYTTLKNWGETNLFFSVLIIGVIYLLEIYVVGRVYSEMYFGTFTADNTDSEVDLSKEDEE